MIQSQNGKKPGKKDEGKKLPKTGESQNVTFLMGIMMMFASAVVAFIPPQTKLM